VLAEERHGPGEDGDVLVHVLVDVGDGGDVEELAVVGAGHPLHLALVDVVAADEEGEDADAAAVVPVELLEDLFGVLGGAVGDHHDHLVFEKCKRIFIIDDYLLYSKFHSI